jgi:hypothetical protein
MCFWRLAAKSAFALLLEKVTKTDKKAAPLLANLTAKSIQEKLLLLTLIKYGGRMLLTKHRSQNGGMANGKCC